MRLIAFSALFVLLPLTAAAGQQPAAPSAASNAVDRKAEAYTNYILGHVNQVQFENTGDQDYAAQAIDYYKKAQAIDPDSVDIQLRIAETYAESQQLQDAIQTAREILKNHPDNLDAHQLLARIYVRSLGNLGASPGQEQTIGLAVDQYEAILKLDPSNNEAGLWLARLYRILNQPGKAEEVLKQMLDRDPTNEQAMSQYAHLLIDEGRASEAIAELTKAASQTGSASLYNLLGDAYTQVHDSAHAEQAYRQAVEIDSGSPSSLRRLASTLFDENKLDEAAKAYQRLTAIDPSDPTGFLRLAEINYQQKKYDLAATNIAKAKQRSPSSLEVIYNQALIEEAQGKLSDAADTLSGAISALKGRSSGMAASNTGVYAILYEELGRIYRRQNNYPAAINTFREMMALGPGQMKRGRLELIETYRQNNQIDDAIDAAQQGLQAEPQDRAMKVTYALLLGEKKETDKAVKTLNSLLDKTAADREIYLDIAQVEQRGGRFGRAERAARTAESMSQVPKQQSAAWFMLGAIYERQKKYAPAEQQFRKVLQVNPKDAQALNYYGYMLAEQGVRLDQASDLVKRALAVDSDNSAYLDSLGWVYFKQHRLAEARDYLLKASAISPSDPTILDHLGDVYDGLGQTDLALTTWEKALTQWRRVVPADYEPDQVRQIERKVAEAKNQSARKKPAAAAMPR